MLLLVSFWPSASYELRAASKQVNKIQFEMVDQNQSYY